MTAVTHPIAPPPAKRWVQSGEASDDGGGMCPVGDKDRVYPHMPPALMHAKHVDHHRASNAHARAGPDTNEHPGSEDA